MSNQYGLEMLEKYQSYKRHVNQAIQEGKVFRIVGRYEWPRLRVELRRRGWVEKRHFRPDSEIADLPHSMLLEEAQPGNEYERALISRMIGNCPPTFLWMLGGKHYSRHLNTPIVNKIYMRNINVGGKDGLYKYFQTIQDANHPRTYDVIGCKELELFEEDYLLTAAITVILFLDNHQNITEKFTNKEVSIKWHFMLKLFDFVQNHIENAHYDIYVARENSKNLGVAQNTRDLILALYEDIYKKGKPIELYHRNPQDHIPMIRTLAQRIRETWPKRQHDGYENIWLLKPSLSGQGNGIILSSDFKEITDLIKADYHHRYVVQKYIERPLLIYNTKFDIRQYFLVTIHKNKIRGWAHSKCTIRLASDEFTFKKLKRSIHITNTAVQIRMKKKSNPNLPDYHMWRVKDLVEYFWKMGKPHAWNEYIFPSIKSTLVQLMKSCEHNIELRPGRFEIFGCDWLVTEDLKTYLLEINRSPSLYYYTSVSVDVVGTVMNDLVKVVVDYMRDETASTGGFELIYELDFDELPFERFHIDWRAYNLAHFRRQSPRDDDDVASEPDTRGSTETLIDENHTRSIVAQQAPMPPPLPVERPATPTPPPSPVRLSHSPSVDLSNGCFGNENGNLNNGHSTNNGHGYNNGVSNGTSNHNRSNDVHVRVDNKRSVTSPSLMDAKEAEDKIATVVVRTNDKNNNNVGCDHSVHQILTTGPTVSLPIAVVGPTLADKYIISPNSKLTRSSDSEGMMTGKSSPKDSCDNGNQRQGESMLGPLSPEMGQDFDPYGESLITY